MKPVLFTCHISLVFYGTVRLAGRSCMIKSNRRTFEKCQLELFWCGCVHGISCISLRLILLHESGFVTTIKFLQSNQL